jgi:hypothetical protein
VDAADLVDALYLAERVLRERAAKGRPADKRPEWGARAKRLREARLQLENERRWIAERGGEVAIVELRPAGEPAAPDTFDAMVAT